MSTDSEITEACASVSAQLTATGRPGEELRERRDLDPLAKDTFAEFNGVRPPSRTLRTPAFPGLGPVDVVLERPRALLELKWSYSEPGKIFESVWDATKLLLLGEEHGYRALYLVTGAPTAQWQYSESADLFRVGELDAVALWSRRLEPPRGPNYGATIGEDLVIGARGNRPREAHDRIAVVGVWTFPVAQYYELRIARITPAGPRVPWPDFGGVGRSGGVVIEETYPLPRRVTQRWIVDTAPRLAAADVGGFLAALRTRGWSERELRQRVIPYLSDESCEDSV